MKLAFFAMGTKLATNLMLTQLSLDPCTLEPGFSCACMNPREALPSLPPNSGSLKISNAHKEGWSPSAPNFGIFQK